MENNMHVLTIENKKSVRATGIKEVRAFTDREIRLRLISGADLKITGDGLKITGFDDKNGTFNAVGNVSGTSYKTTENILKKVLK